jgi:hypothetical protein
MAAWMIDHDARSYEDISHAFVDGQPVANLTRNQVLDNIALTWFTNTGISSARLYHENTVGFLRRQGRLDPGRRERVSRGSSTRRRGAGRSGPIRTSSTTTSSTAATTSRPGRSRSSSPKRSAPCSDRCGSAGPAWHDRVARLRAARSRFESFPAHEKSLQNRVSEAQDQSPGRWRVPIVSRDLHEMRARTGQVPRRQARLPRDLRRDGRLVANGRPPAAARPQAAGRCPLAASRLSHSGVMRRRRVLPLAMRQRSRERLGDLLRGRFVRSERLAGTKVPARRAQAAVTREVRVSPRASGSFVRGMAPRAVADVLETAAAVQQERAPTSAPGWQGRRSGACLDLYLGASATPWLELIAILVRRRWHERLRATRARTSP